MKVLKYLFGLIGVLVVSSVIGCWVATKLPFGDEYEDYGEKSVYKPRKRRRTK